MEGLIGMSVEVPFVREATFILSGYKGAAIWFAPFPAYNYGSQTLYFRTTELTGTKISSMIKAEIFIFPIVVAATLIFSQFIWKIAPVPSSRLPRRPEILGNAAPISKPCSTVPPSPAASTAPSTRPSTGTIWPWAWAWPFSPTPSFPFSASPSCWSTASSAVWTNPPPT